MKILVISDVESKALWDYYTPDRLKGIDLILSCGDLDPRYLSFLVTMTNVPLFYVHGNHDSIYEQVMPEGCVCIEDSIVTWQGLRIAGLGGCMQYNGGSHQYTEREMARRCAKLDRKINRQLILDHLRRKSPPVSGFGGSSGIDILVTHAPAFGIHDTDDHTHRGFHCFNSFLDRWKPAYMVHGHVHLNYSHDMERVTKYKDTTVVNGYEKYILEI